MTFVILGAGLAGWSAAAELRDRGFDGRVVLVGAEPELPYDRPPLSKDYLAGRLTRDETRLRPREWYDEQAIELLTGVRALRLDTNGGRVELDTGGELRYEGLLITTGGRPRRLNVSGSELEGVMYLRSLADADRIRSALVPGLRLSIVGGGFIGLEVAAAARQAGAEVTIIEALAAPLERVLGREMGTVVGELHRAAGVTIRCGSPVQAFLGSDRVTAVQTASGAVMECDAAVVGVGIKPAVEAFVGSGVEVSDGVHVDAGLRTRVPGVYAAGDVARHAHPRHGSLRVEHWQNAVGQGAAAARAMLGTPEPYQPVHWFWSDQYDCNLQYAGFASRWDEVVVRGERTDRKLLACYVADGCVVAAFGMNCGRDVRRAIKLIDSRASVDGALLGDPDTDLRTLYA